MSHSNAPPEGGERELSAQEQFFAMLPLSRLMIECGTTLFPKFGLAEFDACALLYAHSAGRLTLQPATLHAVIRISRGERHEPDRAIRREIEAQAHKLFSRSKAILEANLSTAPDHRSQH
jgi:hypothetical protein